MKYNNIVVTGSNGFTAKGLINYFSKISNTVVGITRDPKVKYKSDNIQIFTSNITKFNDAKLVYSKIVESIGCIDIWINCIGGFSMGPSIESDIEGWNNMYQINFLSCLHGTQVALLNMKKNKKGSIINIGSQAALDGFANASAYLISKSSVHTLTKLTALENKELGIRANAILPGIIDTAANRTAMPNEDFSKWQSSEDIAKTIEFVVDSDINGQLVTVDKQLVK